MNRTKSMLTVTAIVVAAAGFTKPLCAPKQYKIIDLGTLGGGTIEESYSQGVNDRGQVVGASYTLGEGNATFLHAFLWQDGVMSDLGTLGGPTSYATGINARGQVVGYNDDGLGERHVFFWQRGTMTDLGGAPYCGRSGACFLGLNDRGQVVGSRNTPSGAPPYHAFFWQNGTSVDLGTLGGDSTLPRGINEHGQVVGVSTTGSGESHVFLWQDGTMTDLGLPPGTGLPRVAGINDRGQVLVNGFDSSFDGYRVFLWQDGTWTALTTGETYGSNASGAAINDRGQVLGVSATAAGEPHVFLWQSGAMTDLGTFGTRVSLLLNDRGQVVVTTAESVPPDGHDLFHVYVWQEGAVTELETLGGSTTQAYSLDNRGDVAGFYSTASGERHACLWEPPKGGDRGHGDDRDHDDHHEHHTR
jgi:probable HAF family extracellular repeat protein